MAGGRRKLRNPLALAVMVLLAEQSSMHPYEIAQTLRQRGKEYSIKINYGSLYTVVQNLEKHGFVEVADVQRQGNRPERTLYALTPAGREEMLDWMAEIVSVPVHEFPIFETALSLMGVLPPDEVTALLEQRVNTLEVQAAGLRGALRKLSETLPRVFLVETEYQLHMVDAEVEWVRGFLKEVADGTLGGVEGWRAWHATGEVPEEWRELEGQDHSRGRPGATP
ncbi:PadR family transcriptional regulator [Streptomyces sp. NPDC001691]|uniref:PadR family transcriptional regulator n=1 Tax=unclassified Streptomyces TaxID=2593676 RepID=UPI000DEA5FED|nr:PadR family transcriptional regulator [Streptomyces sp. SDr-06]RCH67263.1 PadR family transcriptional regulator [Streptomyces sp. SDr-06]